MYNHFCSVCGKHALKACIHPECDKTPFICQEFCQNNQTLHIHDGKTKILFYEQIKNKVEEIQNYNHSHLVNKIRKRINLVVGDLNNLIDRYEKQLGKLQPDLTIKARQSLDHFTINQRAPYLKGTHLAVIMEKKGIFVDQNANQKLVDKAKQIISEVCDKLQDLKLMYLINTQKAQEHHKKGDEEEKKKDHKSALKEYQLANKYNPLDTRYLYCMGYSAQKMGNLEKALQFYKERLLFGQKQKQTYLYSLNNIGCIYLKKKQYTKALEYFDKAINISPDLHIAYSYRGNTFYCLKEYNKSIEDYSQAIRISPCEMYFKQRAQIYKQIGEKQKAIQDIQNSWSIHKQQYIKKILFG